MLYYKSFSIDAVPISAKFKPVIRNWRGAEMLQDSAVFDDRDGAVSHAKARIDRYFTDNKGMV